MFRDVPSPPSSNALGKLLVGFTFFKYNLFLVAALIPGKSEQEGTNVNIAESQSPPPSSESAQILAGKNILSTLLLMLALITT